MKTEDNAFNFNGAEESDAQSKIVSLNGDNSPKEKGPAKFNGVGGDINEALKTVSAKGSSVSFNPLGQKDRFLAQDDFDSEGFDINNIDEMNQMLIDKETWGSAMGKAFDSFGHRFGNTFTDYWASYGRMLDSLLHADWSKMERSESDKLESYLEDQKDSNKNFVFAKEGEEDDIFSKKFASEMISNAGFSMGTFAGMGLELLGDAGITALTGGSGIGVFGATFARLGIKAGVKSGARSFAKGIAKGYKIGDMSSDAIRGMAIGARPNAASREFVRGYASRISGGLTDLSTKGGAMKFGTKVLETLPGVGDVARITNRIRAAKSVGMGAGEMVGIFGSGMRRLAQEVNMASAEAGFESVTSYGKFIDDAVSDYMDNNGGEPPSADELMKIESMALSSSAANYNTNFAILMATNKLQFGNGFNRFRGATKSMYQFVTDTADDFIKFGAKGTFQRSAFGGSLGSFYKISKQAGKTIGKRELAGVLAFDALKRTTSRFALTEGIQENLQEMSNSAWLDYYLDEYNGREASISESFSGGLDEQFTKQGFKTFLMGALTGMVTGPATTSTMKGINALTNGKSASNARKQMDAKLSQFNEHMANLNDKTIMDKHLINFIDQMNYAQKQAKAAKSGNIKEFLDAKDNSILRSIETAIETNSIDALIDSYRALGVDMTNKDFQESFGYSIEDTKYNSPIELFNSVADDLDKYSVIYEDLTRNMTNKLVNFEAYEKDTDDYTSALRQRAAQEEAIKFLALNAVKGDMTEKRASSIMNDMMSNPLLSESSSDLIYVYGSPEQLTNFSESKATEHVLLRDQINSLKESDEKGSNRTLIAEAEKQYEDIGNEIKLVEEWKSFWNSKYDKTVDENGNEVIDPNRTSLTGLSFLTKEEKEEMREVYLKIVKNKKLLNGIEDGKSISDSQIKDSFDAYYDFLKLDSETKDYMNHVDTLHDPSKFIQVRDKMLVGRDKFEKLQWLRRIIPEYILPNKMNQAGLNGENKKEQFEKLLKTVQESEPYLRLLQYITSDEGIYNAIKNNDRSKEIESIIDTEIDKIRNAAMSVDQDISDEETENALKGDELDSLLVARISRKKDNGINLEKNEMKLYNHFSDQFKVQEDEDTNEEEEDDFEEEELTDEEKAKEEEERVKAEEFDETVKFVNEILRTEFQKGKVFDPLVMGQVISTLQKVVANKNSKRKITPYANIMEYAKTIQGKKLAISAIKEFIVENESEVIEESTEEIPTIEVENKDGKIEILAYQTDGLSTNFLNEFSSKIILSPNKSSTDTKAKKAVKDFLDEIKEHQC